MLLPLRGQALKDCVPAADLTRARGLDVECCDLTILDEHGIALERIPRPRSLSSCSRPSARVNSPSPSESMLILPVAPCSRPHAARTMASFTATQTISSMPFALMVSACCTKLGRWTWEQVRVNAPGTAKRTMRLPEKRSAADTG